MQIQQGLTLLEVLLVLAVIAILMSIAIPFSETFLFQHRAAAEVNQILDAINYARGEALSRGEIVTLCKSQNQRQCNGSWSDGFIVFVDKIGKGVVQEEDDILKVFRPIASKARLEWRAFPSNNYLQMAPNGFTKFQNGTFYYCPPNNDARFARAVIVDQTGRARVAYEDADGNPLVCD